VVLALARQRCSAPQSRCTGSARAPNIINSILWLAIGWSAIPQIMQSGPSPYRTSTGLRADRAVARRGELGEGLGVIGYQPGERELASGVHRPGRFVLTFDGHLDGATMVMTGKDHQSDVVRMHRVARGHEGAMVRSKSDERRPAPGDRGKCDSTAY
jgi:hypothetical protein